MNQIETGVTLTLFVGLLAWAVTEQVQKHQLAAKLLNLEVLSDAEAIHAKNIALTPDQRNAKFKADFG